MEISDFISQFIVLKEKEIEHKIWEVWLAKFPDMSEVNYMSYGDMLDMAKGQNEIKEIPQNGCYIDQCFF
jgi:hypothetical protein